MLSPPKSGRSVSDICHEHGISQGTFYSWKTKYSGMDSLMQINYFFYSYT
ncbi:transposase [Sphingobacterium thalpophilum]